MLLVDHDGQVRSVAPHDVAVPFVREWFGHDVTRVREFLGWCPHDLAFVTAIVDELRRCLASPENNHPYPGGLIEAAARAIAGGLIGVARTIPDNAGVAFDARLPSAPYGAGALMFGSQAVAERFVTVALRAERNAAAFEAMLQNAPSGRQGLAAASGTPADIAHLLVTRQLALLPWSQARHLLRLVWAEHGVPPAAPVQSSAAPPPSSAPPPAPPPDTPAQSTVPDAPDDVSPQAQALIDAADDGTPFCEECARRAAELAAAGG